MKQSKKIINSRRKQILALINEKKVVLNSEISNLFDISPPTVRRDLNYLYNMGLILKKHGRAEAIDSKTVLISQIEKKKELIAKAAASLVDNDDTVFINSSDTSIKTIKYIEPSKYISVVTNNANIINLHILPNVKTILTGGETKSPKTAMTGEFALKNINDVQANKAILGASGFHIEEGMTTANIDEVPVNKAMIKNSNMVILCVDSSKLNHKSAFISGNVNDFDVLITDSEANPGLIKKLEMIGIKCILVNVEKNSF